MTRKAAVTKLLEKFSLPESWRGNIERIYDRLTDSANSIDKETYEQIEQYIRNI